MKHLIIIGVGGFAREVYWHAQNSIGYGVDWDIKGFLDGDIKLPKEEYNKLELPVLGDIDNYITEPDDVFTCAIASSSVRKKLINKLQFCPSNVNKESEVEFINLIHKSVKICPNAILGKGCLLCPNVGVSDHVSIGDFTIINSGTGIGHDTVIGSYCDIMGGVSITGNVIINNFVYVGTGAIFVPHVKIGERAFIGAGSVVLKKVNPDKKVFGNPAMEI